MVQKVGSAGLGVWDQRDPNTITERCELKQVRDKNSILLYAAENIRVKHKKSSGSEVLLHSMQHRTRTLVPALLFCVWVFNMVVYIRVVKRRIILFARFFPEMLLLFLVGKYGRLPAE